MTASIETSGFLELTDELTRMADELVDRGGTGIGEILTRGAEPILEQAKRNVHSISGDLVRGLKIVIKKKGAWTKARIGVQKGDSGYYATFVEYGHKGPRPAGPHPFLAPAFDLKRGEALDIIKAALEAKLKQV